MSGLSDAEKVAEIDDLIDHATGVSGRAGLTPSLRFNVPLTIFEHYHDDLDAGGELSYQKCACGSCGKIVAAFDVPLVAEEDENERSVVWVSFVREATEEETLRILEGMVE